MMYRKVTAALALFTLACSTPAPEPEPAAEATPTQQAELLATDGSWGNTEGPAVDLAGALYFTSRGTYKGIIKWTKEGGAQQYAPVASKAGPGGLWIDGNDNIYLTATDEREVQKLAPDGTITTIAKGFEADPATATGPNDITVSASGIVYFTDPNGYRGEAAPGTVYRIDAQGATSVFDDTVVGPNGIVLSADDRTLYVAHNVSDDHSELVRWPLAEDGSAAGPKEVIAKFDPCVADGMAVDAKGRIWVTCYSYGTAHLIDPATGEIVERVTTEQKALTNAVFGRGADSHSLYLSSSDMDRVTGYVYKATVETGGTR
ncbi:MAG: SMP-30/gluconolactonase/LRE family protein [Bryobacterales bacterium]|nr:SMP-30/gluconolactonase/LRE family protein [Bryobacterales bacterium]